MGWRSISVTERTFKKLEKMKKKREEVLGRNYSMNELINELIEVAGG